MRDTCLKLKPEEFLLSDQYKDKHIWDLKYISTSDDEDNDSETSDEEEEHNDEEE